MPSVAAFLSFRFGHTDGVSVVARTWMDAMERMGFTTTTISGQAGSDIVVEGLGLSATGRPVDLMADDLEDALAGVDLVVVENLLTIPLNLDASRAALRALAGRPVLVHHHDPPWHRERFAHVTELPVDSPGWRHVAINRVLQRELQERGIAATLIYNGFEIPDLSDPTTVADTRERIRGALGVNPDEFVVAHPVRAIGRKNIPAAIRLCEEIGATYWLLGPPEEDYEDELTHLLDGATCRVIHRPMDSPLEIFAACDHVTFPSTWEGFGNPPIEASLFRRSVDVGTYPVADELRSLGFHWLDSDDPASVAALHRPENGRTLDAMLDSNRAIAREHFSSERMAIELEEVLRGAGWLP